MSCHSATANQVRLAFHTAAYWLMLAVRDAIPQTDPLAKAEFATIRERLIKIRARVIEHLARIRIQLPTSCPEGALFRTVARGTIPSAPRAAGLVARTSRRRRQINPNALQAELYGRRSDDRSGGARSCEPGAKTPRVVHDPG